MKGGYIILIGIREIIYCDFDWDDEWDKEFFFDVQIQNIRDVDEGVGIKSFLRQDNRM